MKNKICPQCGTDNIAPAEQEYTTEYPLWTVFIAIFFFIAIFLIIFFFLQLHPVIMILLVIAVVSKLLSLKSSHKKKAKKVEYICLECEHRFSRKE
jgi:peptidoglycan/LPS O-acetylase OafA/YrhL